MKIVSQVHPRPWPLRAGKATIRGAGYLLIVFAVILAIPAFALIVLIPIALLSGDEVVPSIWIALAGSTVGGLVLFWLGMHLARGRRHLVLFLRRFGFDDASLTLTYAVNGAMGRRWRLVTLDDSEIKPVGVGRRVRLVWRIARWLALATLVGAVAYIAVWWLGGGIDSVIDRIFNDADTGNQDSFGDAIGAAIGATVAAVVVLAFLVLFAIIAISTLSVLSVGLWQGDRAVRRAEGAKALILDNATDIAPVVDRIRGHAGKIQAPRLIVLKVSDAIWRDVVEELAEEASIALLDVSDPTDHLLWEVGVLQGDVRARMLPIGRRDRVEALVSAAHDSPAGRLRTLLNEETVLVYEPNGGRSGARRFARSLAAAMDRLES